MAMERMCARLLVNVFGFIVCIQSALALPGGWQDYPVYEGDPEYNFAVAAINSLRSNCDLQMIPWDNFTVFDDECFYSVIDSARLIWISVEIDVGTQSPMDLFVELSTEESIGNLGEAEEPRPVAGNYTLVGVFNSDNDYTNAMFCNYSAGNIAKRRRTFDVKNSITKPRIRYTTTPKITDEMWSAIPSNWDWRDHLPSEIFFDSKAAASTPLSQGACGSCYVFGGITAMAYRFNIASNGTVNAVPSPQVVMSCTNGCNGGSFDMVYSAMKINYVPSDKAEPYTEQASQCIWSKNTSMPYKARDFTSVDDSMMPADDPQPFLKAVLGERAMMHELYSKGPGGVYIKVEAQFQSYAGDSVLDDKTCTRGLDGVTCMYTSADTNHACTLIGWGVEQGKKYWLIQNSWGSGWGMNGFLKIARGVNALGVETDGLMVGAADLTVACKGSPACHHGGTYMRDCGCLCPVGWNGSTCENCNKNCSWQAALILPGTTGTLSSLTGCVCQCANGFMNPSNLVGFPDCGLRALLYLPGDSAMTYYEMVTPLAPGPISFDFGLAFAPGTSFSTLNMVKQGDMLVAVEVGKKPWTPQADWGTTKFKADICGPKKWNSADHTAIPCSGISRGNLTISEQGIYDIYYVKYDGKSEFGVDKGYGKDFIKLSQQLCTYVNGSMCSTSLMQNLTAQNELAQKAEIQQLSLELDRSLARTKKIAKDRADEKLSDFVAKNILRIMPFRFVLVGFGSEYIGKNEKAAIETVVAHQAGIVCGNLPAPPRECTNKDVKIVSVQEIAMGKRVFSSNLTKPLYGAIAFDGNLTAYSSVMATGGFQNLTDSIASGAMLLALQKSETTNLQYLTAIRNTMFCTGATFKCPVIDAKRSESASLKISSYTYSEHSFLMKDIIRGSSGDFSVDFYAWQVKLNQPLYARERCAPYNVLTLEQVWQKCNPSGSANPMACALPIKFQCAAASRPADEVWNYDSLTSGQALFAPILIYGPPVDMPFIHLLNTIPQVPVYDLFRVNDMVRHNNTLNIFAVRSMGFGDATKIPNPNDVFNSTILERCRQGMVILGGDCPNCLYDFVPSMDSSTPIKLLTTGSLAQSQPVNKPCTVRDVIGFEDALAFTLDKINNASSNAEFTKAVNTLNVVENLDAYVGCNALINKMTRKTPEPSLVFGGRSCELDSTDPSWLLDPCCNYQLQFSMCCPEQTRQVVVNKLSGIDYTFINSTVPTDNSSMWLEPKKFQDPESGETVYFPSETGYVSSATRQLVLDSIISALGQHVQADVLVQDSSQGCEAKLKNSIPPNYLSIAIDFFPKCIDTIFKLKTKTGKGKCASDSDCYTACNLRTRQCTSPTTGIGGNIDDAFVRCAVDRMKPDVLLYIRDSLGIESLPVEDGPFGPGFNHRMAQALTDAVSSYNCDGPSEYSDGACFIDVPDSECTQSSFALDPNGNYGNGMTLSQSVSYNSSGELTIMPSSPDRHVGQSIQYQYIIIRRDVTDQATCLQLIPNSPNVEWVNVTMNGGRDLYSTGPTYTRSVCRIKSPQLPNLDQGISQPSTPVGSCNDYSIPNAQGKCADGTTAGPLSGDVVNSSIPTCFDGSQPDPGQPCDNGQYPGWVPPQTSCGDNQEGNCEGDPVAVQRRVSRRSSFTCPSTRRSTTEACDRLADPQAKYDCILRIHFQFLCNGLPDIEHTFDPDVSTCTTWTNLYPSLSLVDHQMLGVGRCKVANFGITPNGLLPFGFMSDDANGNYAIDWRSPLTQYLDSAQNPVNISTTGASIAETRCKQTRNALKAIGLNAKSAQFYRYRTITKTIYDHMNDQFLDQSFPGNKTMCELERKCNSDSISALLSNSALSKDQCSSPGSKKSRSLCGLRLDASSFQEVSVAPLCYLDQRASSRTSCELWGGKWDEIEYQQNPQSAFTCSANDLFSGAMNCWNNCPKIEYTDSYSQKTYSFHGECEAYDLCTINANMSVCSMASADSKWMKFDLSVYSLLPTSDADGICVVFYANKWNPGDVGGDSSLSSAAGCSSKTYTVYGQQYSGQAQPARSFRDGFVNSSSQCSAGICPSQLWDPSSTCTKSLGSCSIPCGGCRALMDYEPGWYQLDPNDPVPLYSAPTPRVSFVGGKRRSVCYDLSFKNATSCSNSSGMAWSYKNELCYVTADAGSCSSPRNLFTCDKLAIDRCTSNNFFASDNTTLLLQCVFDRQLDCLDQSSCEAASNGACDDAFLEDPSMPSWALAGPACIVPFLKGDSYGYPNTSDCDTDAFTKGIAYSDPKLGCIYWPQRLSPSITINGESVPFGNTSEAQAATCHQAGGYLSIRSRSQDSCENGNHSWACIVDRSFMVPISGMDCTNDAICSQQDYSWENIRSWTTGSWSVSSTTLSTTWINRTWAPINVWTSSFDFDKLSSLVVSAVGNKIQQAFGSYVRCSLGLYGTVFSQVASAVDQKFAQPAGSTSAPASGKSDQRLQSVVQGTELTVQTSAVDIQPMFDVIVVGAGISGISAARELVDLGYNVLVIESKAHLGGRLRSDRSLGFPVDLGATWLSNKDETPISSLVRQYGLPLKKVDYAMKRFRSNGTQYSDSELLASELDSKNFMSKVLAMAKNLTTDQSLAELGNQIDSILFRSESEQWRTSTSVELDHGASVEMLSSISYGMEHRWNGSRDDYVFPTGYDQLVNQSNLAANITVLNSTRVTYIDYTNGTVAVATDSGQFLLAKTVIVAVPLGVLKKGDISFNPPLPVLKQQAIQKVEMGTMNKVFLKWNDLSWVPSAFNATNFIGVDTASPTKNTRGLFNYFINGQAVYGVPGFLTFAVGQSGKDMELWNDTEIVNKSVSQLQKAVAAVGGGLVPQPDRWLITRWNSDPDTYGSFSYSGVNVTDIDIQTLAMPVQSMSTILFAGEHTSKIHRGTVQGAYMSGKIAAEQALNVLIMNISSNSPPNGRRLLAAGPAGLQAKKIAFPQPKKLPDPQMKCPAGGITVPQETMKLGALNTALNIGRNQTNRNLSATTRDPRAKPAQAKVKDTARLGMAVSSAANFHNPSLEPKKISSKPITSSKRRVGRQGRQLLDVTSSSAPPTTSGITTATTRPLSTSVSVRTSSAKITTAMRTTPPPIIANMTCGTCDYRSSCMTGYAVVKNSQGIVVGQLIGASLSQTGIDLSSGGEITICFNPDPNIPQCVNESKFPIADVAVSNSSLPKSRQVFTILTVNVTIGVQYCARISAPAPGLSYWPIRRARVMFPKASVLVAVTISSISDPTQFNNATLQNAFKFATAAGLGAGVNPSDVTITLACKSDGSSCITPMTPQARRLLATGVTATASVTTTNADTVSSAVGSSSFAGSFVQSWQASPAQAIAPVSTASISAQSLGIQQPLAPLSPDSPQAKSAASSRAAIAASGQVYTNFTKRTSSTTPAPTTQAAGSPATTPPKLNSAPGNSPSAIIGVITLAIILLLSAN